MSEEPENLTPAPIVHDEKVEKEASQKTILIWLVVIVILVLAGLAAGTIFLLQSDVAQPVTFAISSLFLWRWNPSS